ncbi:MAG TPA: SDR family oxidoreductase [Bryobacteraceae bacterium]|nr:SDR family oxidoreductase [Bryobacteraceae bacterium]
MILVTGASGVAGSSVLQEVLKAGKPVAAMYRTRENAAQAPAEARTVIADFADKASLGRALDGVDSVYVACSPVRELVELEGSLLDACRQAGVRHVVLNSALGAGDYPRSFPSWHRKVEDQLKESGLGYTILRPNSFMQNILTYYAPTIRTQGAFYGAMGNARTSLIDVRDLGVVAARTLTSPGHIGKTYELNGPEAVTYSEVAEAISRASGQPVQYINIPLDQQRKAMLDQGMPEWQVTALLDLQAYYTGGQGGQVDNVLSGLLGRAPVTLAQFLAEFAASFKAQTGHA